MSGRLSSLAGGRWPVRGMGVDGRGVRAVLAAAVAGCASGSAWAQCGGDVTFYDIGASSASGSFAYDINEDGAVAGVLRTLALTSAFRWSREEGLTQLPRLSGTLGARADAISPSGVVAGEARASAGAVAPIAVLWGQDGTIQSLGAPAGAAGATATGIDALGRVAGVGFGPPGVRTERGFRWAGGTFAPFGSSPGEAAALSSGGFTAASALTPDGWRGQAWLPSARTLPPLAGDSWSEATGIVDSGAAVGASGAALRRRPVYWRADQTPVNIPLLDGSTGGTAMGLNALGEVVGFCDGPGGQRAFYWSESTGTIDLNAQLPSEFAGVWTLTQARAINSSRSIAGVAEVRAAGVPKVWRGFRLDLRALAVSCPADLNGDCAVDVFDLLRYFELFSDAAEAFGPDDNRLANAGFEMSEPGDPSRPAGWARLNNTRGGYERSGLNGAPAARTGARLISVSGEPSGGFNSWNPVLGSAAAHAPVNLESDLTLSLHYSIPGQSPAFSTGLFAAKIEFLAGQPGGGVGPVLGTTGDLRITSDLSPTAGWVSWSRTLPVSVVPEGADLARVLVYTFDGSGSPTGRVFIDDVALRQADPIDPIVDRTGDGRADVLDILAFFDVFAAGCG